MTRSSRVEILVRPAMATYRFRRKSTRQMRRLPTSYRPRSSVDVEPSEVVSVDVESLGGVGSAVTSVGALADVVGDALDVAVGDAVGATVAD